MLTVRQAAERAGVCESLVRSWCGSGLVPHFRLGAPGKRGAIRIAEGDLDAFLASQKREGRRPAAPPRKRVRLENLKLA